MSTAGTTQFAGSLAAAPSPRETGSAPQGLPLRFGGEAPPSRAATRASLPRALRVRVATESFGPEGCVYSVTGTGEIA